MSQLKKYFVWVTQVPLLTSCQTSTMWKDKFRNLIQTSLNLPLITFNVSAKTMPFRGFINCFKMLLKQIPTSDLLSIYYCKAVGTCYVWDAARTTHLTIRHTKDTSLLRVCHLTPNASFGVPDISPSLLSHLQIVLK